MESGKSFILCSMIINNSAACSLCFAGIFLESSGECAFRELKEETGMMIRLSDVEDAPYVDLYNTDKDNLNPHKG